MPKWKTYYENATKYNSRWENKFAWLYQAYDGSGHAYCKLCKLKIAPKVQCLIEHEKSKGHSSRMNAASMCKPLLQNVQRKESDVQKRIETEISVFVACHCSLSSVDHLGEMIKKNGKGSDFENMQLHRTKCSKLITKVVAPALLDELKNDIKGKKYCILVDESTDISTTKHVCVVLCYYSDARLKIVTEFAGLEPIVGATGHDIFFGFNKAC